MLGYWKKTEGHRGSRLQVARSGQDADPRSIGKNSSGWILSQLIVIKALAKIEERQRVVNIEWDQSQYWQSWIKATGLIGELNASWTLL